MTVALALKPLKVLVIASWISGSWLCLRTFGSPWLSGISQSFVGQGAADSEDYAFIWSEHPIKTLVRKAEVEFDDQLARQSKTLEAATAEYLQRYHRTPPPGFDMWYEYAVKHDSLIIDDFDIINETLTPFWKLSGLQVRRRLAEVREDGWAIQFCDSEDGELTGECGHLGDEVLKWLSDADDSPDLPEVNLLINVLDEPRVMSSGIDTGAAELKWTDHSKLRVWEELTAACGSLAVDRQLQSNSLVFSDGKLDTLDLCQHPEYANIHGFWDAPSNLQTTNLTVPILSSAVLSTMGDIPVPAAAYSSSMYSYDESEDISWNEKTAGLYWAGKTTGSIQSTNWNWKRHHRQRFVKLAEELDWQPHLYLQSSDDGQTWKQHRSIATSDVPYKAYFTEIVQFADETTRSAIHNEHNIHEPDPRSEGFKYTLAFDLDGNGHSGRFYRLLNSWSLPLKQTVFREWHDERLQPWLHYVPISLGMQELPEVVRYLSIEEEGQQLAELMAEEGREWSLRALRPVDQAIYLYRLILELARLQDPERVASWDPRSQS